MSWTDFMWVNLDSGQVAFRYKLRCIRQGWRRGKVPCSVTISSGLSPLPPSVLSRTSHPCRLANLAS